MHRSAHRHLVSTLACLCVTTSLLTACSNEDTDTDTAGRTASSSPSASKSPSKSASKGSDGEVNRDDVNGDGHADVVVNGWYRAKDKAEWQRNRFVALAAPGGTEPGAAFRLPERLPELDPRISSGPIGHDQSTQYTGDLDGDGHADVVTGDMVPDSEGEFTSEQRIVWGGSDGLGGATELPADDERAAATGDFDGDGALDLMTLAAPSFSESADGPQPATVLYGPFERDGAKPRTTSTLDVGHGGWASVVSTFVGDFDGDGRDDLVTKARYDEEDARLEDGLPEGVTDSTFYRGTAKGLKSAGSVPGISNGATPVAVGDFDGDGKQDIFGEWPDDERAAVVYGDSKGPGRGEARSGDLGELKVALAVAVGDVNGDGHDDAAIQSLGGDDRRVGQVVVLLGGEGGLSADRTVTLDRYAIGLGGSPASSGDRDHFGWDLYLADLDTDGRDELLIGTFGFNKPRKDAGYWILRGTQDGPSKTDRRFVKTKDFGSG
ncbi:FG-GAP repeat domain-containing protein [Streptomyces tailanensis]|uniref:FG-GAP repeat domain-containing protein n=1 Tax=Streptomyces tailanensis TaxID=2569858 RepID=UPI00122DDD02|nr:VCBS repeat-containing protein [Streptomyces tailanensis]